MAFLVQVKRDSLCYQCVMGLTITLLQTQVPAFLHSCALHSPPHSAYRPLEVLTSCTGPTPGRHCRTQVILIHRMWALKGPSQSSKPTPSPRIVEPWHLRCGNPSLPTHSLRAKEDKNPSPVQGRETFIPARGLDIQQRGSRQESAAVIAQDGCQWVRAGRHSVLVALSEAGLDCGFSSGAVCSLLSKAASAC